ncbi:MAG: 2-dehydropantoate 2-reductase [Firmicutes bacterium]|jgi:2-dehydropantoate 2-reductase|nr:2-dehydropantoate 2-reductase [Bacillota bacterium]
MNHKIKRVSIIGLGALGILYGEHFSKYMDYENLRIVADKGRINRYRSEGIFCNGEECNFNYVSPEENVDPADLIIFAVKYPNLQEAIKMVENHVGENTIILSVLNGIESEKDIAEVYGEEHNLYCIAYGMTASKVRNQVNYLNKGIIEFGELKESINSNKVGRLKDFFDLVNLPYEVNNNMEVKLWSKLMCNVGFNQTVAYHNSNNESIQKEGPEREMLIAAMEEVLTVANKEGVSLEYDELNYWLELLNGLNPEGMPSMAQDVKAKRYSEFELFSGTVVRLAAKHNIDVPVNTKFYKHFSKLEASY